MSVFTPFGSLFTPFGRKKRETVIDGKAEDATARDIGLLVHAVEELTASTLAATIFAVRNHRNRNDSPPEVVVDHQLRSARDIVREARDAFISSK